MPEIKKTSFLASVSQFQTDYTCAAKLELSLATPNTFSQVARFCAAAAAAAAASAGSDDSWNASNLFFPHPRFTFSKKPMHPTYALCEALYVLQSKAVEEKNKTISSASIRSSTGTTFFPSAHKIRRLLGENLGSHCSSFI